MAGADEVGRGCLAGPLVAAAVVFDCTRLVGPVAAELNALDDSKKMDPADRARIAKIILRHAVACSVVVKSSTTIDRIGLHKCNLAALQDAVVKLDVPIDIALIDGFEISVAGINTERLVKGDAKSAAISAASVIAKEARDVLMHRLDVVTGGTWEFTDHVGYATQQHRDLIAKHGVSDQHRMSFASEAYERMPVMA